MNKLLTLFVFFPYVLFAQVHKIGDKLASASFEYQLDRFDQYIKADSILKSKTLFFNTSNNSGFQRITEGGLDKILFFQSKQRLNMYYIEEYVLENNGFFVKEYYAHFMLLHGKPFFWIENPGKYIAYKVDDWDTLSQHIKKIEIVLKYFTSVLKLPNQKVVAMY